MIPLSAYLIYSWVVYEAAILYNIYFSITCLRVLGREFFFITNIRSSSEIKTSNLFLLIAIL